MRFFTTLSFLLFASVALMAQGFAYLNLTTADGAERSIAAAQVKITFADGALVAHGADGGEVLSYCYDDCINCTGKIYVSGAKVVCFSNGNDAVDSNANTNGSVEVSDGVLVAVSSKGSPEMGIDADGNSRITIKGGYVFTGGGSQGGSSSTIGSASQGYYWLTGKSFSETNYYTLADASNNNIFTIKLPSNCNVNSSYSLISAPQMVKGSTYTLKSSTTAPTDATSEFEDIYLGSSAKGTTTVASFTAQ